MACFKEDGLEVLAIVAMGKQVIEKIPVNHLVVRGCSVLLPIAAKFQKQGHIK